jgi:hypothetical protein
MNGLATLAEKIPFAVTLPYAIPVTFVEIAASTCNIILSLLETAVPLPDINLYNEGFTNHTPL